MFTTLKQCHWGNWFNPSKGGEGIELSVIPQGSDFLLFGTIYLLTANGPTWAFCQKLASEALVPGQEYQLQFFQRGAVNTDPYPVGTLVLIPDTDGTMYWRAVLFDPQEVREGTVNRLYGPFDACAVEPPSPPGGFPPYTSARFNVSTSSLPDFPFGQVRNALNSDVFNGELVVDCASFKIVAPLWGAINAGRTTQNPDNGSLSIWYSREPAGRELIDEDIRAAGTGFQLNWMLPGGSPQTDRYPLNPGESYFVNFAFCDSNIWRTEGRIVGIKPGISEVRADCTLG